MFESNSKGNKEQSRTKLCTEEKNTEIYSREMYVVLLWYTTSSNIIHIEYNSKSMYICCTALV